MKTYLHQWNKGDEFLVREKRMLHDNPNIETALWREAQIRSVDNQDFSNEQKDADSVNREVPSHVVEILEQFVRGDLDFSNTQVEGAAELQSWSDGLTDKIREKQKEAMEYINESDTDFSLEKSSLLDDQNRNLNIERTDTALRFLKMLGTIENARRLQRRMTSPEQTIAYAEKIAQKAFGGEKVKTADAFNNKINQLHRVYGLIFTAHPVSGPTTEEAKITQEMATLMDFDRAASTSPYNTPRITEYTTTSGEKRSSKTAGAIEMTELLEEVSEILLNEDHPLYGSHSPLFKWEYETSRESYRKARTDFENFLETLLVESIDPNMPLSELRQIDIPRIFTLATWVGYDGDSNVNEVGIPEESREKEEELTRNIKALKDIRTLFVKDDIEGKARTGDHASLQEGMQSIDDCITFIEQDVSVLREKNEEYLRIRKQIENQYEEDHDEKKMQGAIKKLDDSLTADLRIHAQSGKGILEASQIIEKITPIMDAIVEKGENKGDGKRARVALINLKVLENLLESVRLTGPRYDPRKNHSFFHEILREKADELGIFYAPKDEETKTDYREVMLSQELSHIIQGVQDNGPLQNFTFPPDTERFVKKYTDKMDIIDKTGMRILIANCDRVSDILSALLVFEQAGIADKVDIMPLFEDNYALENAPKILEGLFESEVFMKYLRRRDNILHIELGHSDGTRYGSALGVQGEGGIIQENKEKMLDLIFDKGAEKGIKVVFYDTGSKMAYARDGRPTAESYFESNTGAKTTGEKIYPEFSDQGEDHYARRMPGDLAKEIFLLYEKRLQAPEEEMSDELRSIAKELSVNAKDAYLEKFDAHDSENFIFKLIKSFFHLTITPGSRKAARSAGEFMADLRAIVQNTSDMHDGLFSVETAGASKAIEKIGIDRVTRLWKEGGLRGKTKLLPLIWAVEMFDEDILRAHVSLNGKEIEGDVEDHIRDIKETKKLLSAVIDDAKNNPAIASDLPSKNMKNMIRKTQEAKLLAIKEADTLFWQLSTKIPNFELDLLEIRVTKQTLIQAISARKYNTALGILLAASAHNKIPVNLKIDWNRPQELVGIIDKADDALRSLIGFTG